MNGFAVLNHRFTDAVNQTLLGAIVLVALAGVSPTASGQTSFAQTAAEVEPKVVKIYGAGGIQGLEAYQSGFLVSKEGEVLTVWSYVLDAEVVTVQLADGRRLAAEVKGMDPRLEIALLKIEATDLPYFALEQAVELVPGNRVLAFNNLYGIATGEEPSSVLHGIVSAKTSLTARSGAYDTAYRGSIYVLDAMTNNPGAPGGVVTDQAGRIVGLSGKELRNSQTGALLNYALPVAELLPAVDDIRSGKLRPLVRTENAKRPKEAHSLASLGIRLVPDLLLKTPPYVESVKRGSPAERAGLKPDDLILMIAGRLVSSCKVVSNEISFMDQLDEVRLTVQRDQELVEISLTAGN